MNLEVKRQIEFDGIRNALLNTIPDGMTNGDVITSLFPNIKVSRTDYFTVVVDGFDKKTEFRLDWWNAPFKKGE